MSPDEVFPVFIGAWVFLGVAGFAMFVLGKDVLRKRKLWAPFVIFTGVLFIGFVYLMGFGGEALYIVVPAIVLITFLNVKSAKFCDACGKALFNQNILAKPAFCSKCGAKLE